MIRGKETGSRPNPLRFSRRRPSSYSRSSKSRLRQSSCGTECSPVYFPEAVMELHRYVRRLVFLVAISMAPVLGGIGWKHSPGKEAFLGALAYWPLLLLGTLISAATILALYSSRSVSTVVLLLPGSLFGGVLLWTFLTLDYRSERAELTSQSGLRGVVYEDDSGEFGVDFYFTVTRPNGDIVGEAFLGWFLSPDEVDFRIREVKSQLQVVERADPSTVRAWYSPASDQVLHYRDHLGQEDRIVAPSLQRPVPR